MSFMNAMLPYMPDESLFLMQSARAHPQARSYLTCLELRVVHTPPQQRMETVDPTAGHKKTTTCSRGTTIADGPALDMMARMALKENPAATGESLLSWVK